MLTLLYPAYDQLEISDGVEPVPGPGEVRLRVAACGICGSELEAFRNHSPRRIPPLVMGHEFCGVVEEIGRDVESFTAGERVVSHSLVSCGRCVRCSSGRTHLCAKRCIFGMQLPGGFAEYVVTPEHSLIRWPEHVPAESACLTEPLANGVHIVNLTRRLEPKTIAVIGAGAIGLLCQQAFQSMHRNRKRRCRQLGHPVPAWERRRGIPSDACSARRRRQGGPQASLTFTRALL